MPISPLPPRIPKTRFPAIAGALSLVLIAGPARASFLSGEALDTAANVIAWVALILVPVIAITVFWIVHVMPEKIAHKRHHPQTQAIQTLCLLEAQIGEVADRRRDQVQRRCGILLRARGSGRRAHEQGSIDDGHDQAPG